MFSVVSGENQEWWELFRKASVGISSLSGKISAETALIQSWFFLLWKFGVSALFQRKSALFSSVSEKISAETALIQRWFFCSENLVFQRCFRENQLCFRENQRWNSSDSALIFLLWKFPVSELFQRKSALFSSESALFQSWTALFQRWFLALKISVFSAVQSWISAVQRFSGNEQRWNRPESILKQSWSALNVSETSTRDSEHRASTGCPLMVPQGVDKKKMMKSSSMNTLLSSLYVLSISFSRSSMRRFCYCSWGLKALLAKKLFCTSAG